MARTTSRITQRALTERLLERFPGATVELETRGRGYDTRVLGEIIWEGFEGTDALDRQLALREVVRSLPPEQAEQVTFIMTITPHQKKMFAIE